MPLNVAVPAPYISSPQRSKTISAQSAFQWSVPQSHHSDNALQPTISIMISQTQESTPAPRVRDNSFYRSPPLTRRMRMHVRTGRTSLFVPGSGIAIPARLRKGEHAPHNFSTGNLSHTENQAAPTGTKSPHVWFSLETVKWQITQSRKFRHFQDSWQRSRSDSTFPNANGFE